MSDITFTSGIRPVTSEEFSKCITAFPRDGSVAYPWLISSSRVRERVYTKGICDCSSCLITDGEKALLMHLVPDVDDNHDFKKVLNFISNNIDLKNKNLQAILVGAKSDNPISMDIFNKFKSMLITLKMPFTSLLDGKGGTHIAYKTNADELIITNPEIDTAILSGKNSSEALGSGFKSVNLCELDEIV